MVAVPMHWTGRKLPLPTIMREVVGVVEESIPDLPAMCDKARCRRASRWSWAGWTAERAHSGPGRAPGEAHQQEHSVQPATVVERRRDERQERR